MSKHTTGLTSGQVLGIAEKYGEFQFGDAQGHKRIAFAADVIAARERIRDAAPELLEALREIADDYADRFDLDSPSTNPGMKYVVRRARAAIAKATGEQQ